MGYHSQSKNLRNNENGSIRNMKEIVHYSYLKYNSAHTRAEVDEKLNR